MRESSMSDRILRRRSGGRFRKNVSLSMASGIAGAEVSDLCCCLLYSNLSCCKTCI